MPVLEALIAEADPMLRSLYAEYLSRTRGYCLGGYATSGPELFRCLQNRRPALVLLDLFLPEFGGQEGLRRSRTEFPRVDHIILSEGDDPDTVRGALCLGAFDYLIKPFTFDRFHAALDAYGNYYWGLTGRKTPWRQADLDKILHGRTVGRGGEVGIPKGLQEPVLRQVVRVLQMAECPLAAAEMGERLGLSRSTARRYLEFLVETELVRVEHAYKEIGRPLKQYVLKRTASPLASF